MRELVQGTGAPPPLPLVGVGWYVLQVLVATIGVLLWDVLFLTLVPDIWVTGSTEVALFSSWTIVGALLAGLSINGRLRRRSGTWVWILPMAWFFVAVGWDAWDMLGSPRPCGMLRTLWAMFVSGNVACGGEEEGGLRIVFVTIPMLASLLYSLGAWLALRRHRRGAAASPSPNAPIL